MYICLEIFEKVKKMIGVVITIPNTKQVVQHNVCPGTIRDGIHHK